MEQLDSREGFVHYEQSNVNTALFPDLNDAEVLSQRHQTVGCNITYIIRFLEGLYPFWIFVLMNNPGIYIGKIDHMTSPDRILSGEY